MLGAAEIRAMAITENIVTWYQDRERDEEARREKDNPEFSNRPWVEKNRDLAGALTEAHRAAEQYGLLKE